MPQYKNFPFIVVAVAQLVESRIVIPVVVGSSPIVHPISNQKTHLRYLFFKKTYKFNILGILKMQKILKVQNNVEYKSV